MEAASIVAGLRETQWKIRTSTGTDLLPDGQLVRYIPNASRLNIHEVVQFLRLYTDASNSARKAYVENLTIDGKLFAGKWRGGEVHIVHDPDNPQGPAQIEQVLLQGLLTTLPYSEARMFRTRLAPGDAGTNATEDYVDIQWIGVDPDSARSLAAAKVSTADIDAVKHRKFTAADALDATQVTIGDNYYHLDTLAELQADGTYTITWRVGKPRFTIEGVSDYGTSRAYDVIYHFNVPKPLVQSVVDAWHTAHPVGSSSSVSYNTSGAVADIILRKRILDAPITREGEPTAKNCEQVETTDFYWGVADPDTYPMPDQVAGHDYRRSVRDNGDGTYDVEIRDNHRQNRNIPVYTRAEDASSSTTLKEDRGVTDLATVDITTTVAGKRVDLSIETLEDCSKVVRKGVETPKDQDHTNTEIRADLHTVSQVDTVAAASLSTPTPSAGQTIAHSSRETPFGFRTETETRTIQPQQVDRGEVRADVVTVEVENTAAASAQAAPTPSAGELKKYESAPTQFKDKHRTRVITETVQPQQIDRGDVSADVVTVEVENTAAATAQTAPTPGDGELKKYESVPTRYKNKHRTRVITETVQNQQIDEKEVKPASTVVRTIKTATTAETLPTTHTAGIRRVVRNTPTSYKDKLRTEVEEETFTADALSVPSHVHVRSPKVEQTITKYVDSTTEPALGGSDYGIVQKEKDPVTGRWNGSVDIHTFAATLDYTSGFISTGLTNTKRIYMTKDYIMYYADRTITFDIKQTKNASDAWSYINGGLDGSNVVHVGTMYRAMNVTAITEPSSSSDWHSMGGPS